MKRFNLPTVARALSLLKNKKRPYLAFILGFCVMEILCSLLYTLGIRGVIDAITTGSPHKFWLPMGMILLNHLIWWSYSPISAYFTHRISAKAMAECKTEFCCHIVRLPYSANRDTGALLSNLSGDMSCLSGLYDWNFCDILRSALGGFAGVIVMTVIDWRFALVVLTLGTVSVLLSSHFSKKLEELGEIRQEKLAKTSTDAYELVQGAKTLRLMHLESGKEQQFRTIAGEEAKIKEQSGKTTGKMNANLNTVNLLTYICLLFMGALFVHLGLSDWGTVIALLGMKTTTDMLFVECGQFLATMQLNAAGIKRIFALTDLPAEGPLPEKSPLSPVNTPMGSSLQMEDVSFAYEAGKPVLNHFNLCLNTGALTVLSGESGAGKSTIIQLLLGLYEPQEGRILCGENHLRGGKLREHSAYVPQSPMLFRGSIYENIAFGKENARPEEVYEAARLAGAEDFIQAAPQGYDTPLQDNGQGLSVGQKQRLAIARALLKNAPILLLDEVTSALDQETEEQLLETIKKISGHKAVLLISHHERAMAKADHLIQLST